MIPFQTTTAQILQLASFVVKMNQAGLDQTFIVNAYDLARTDQGVFDLIELWHDAKAADREEIVADIQDALDDYTDMPPIPQKKPRIPYDKLGDVATRVMAAKTKLRVIVDKHGGVSAVAVKTGIPQPSLSRMLNTPSIPRRSTLYKMANALGLTENEIAMEWTR